MFLRLLLAASVLAGIIGLSFLVLVISANWFRGLIGLLPSWGVTGLGLASFLVLALSVTVITAQPWPRATVLVEYSLWLALLATGVLAADIAWLISKPKAPIFSFWVGIGSTLVALIGLILILLPTLNMLALLDRLEAETKNSLGSDYLNHIPDNFKVTFRPTAFSWIDYWFGIDRETKSYLLTENVTYCTSDSEQLLLDIYQPQSAILNQNFPILLIIHGGGWETGDKTDVKEFNHYLASRGWVIFAINYRLAPAYHYPAAQQDVTCALRYIAQNATKYHADLTRLAVMGRSAGGTLALNAAYAASAWLNSSTPQPLPKIQAVVAYYPPTNLVEWYNQRDSNWGFRLVANYLGGSPEEQPEAYASASPLSYTKNKLPRTLLVQAGNDQAGLRRHGVFLAEKLQSRANPVLLLNLPWAGHAFDIAQAGISNQIALYYTERFLAFSIANPVLFD
jgi:acetyl esterase/lipase